MTTIENGKKHFLFEASFGMLVLKRDSSATISFDTKDFTAKEKHEATQFHNKYGFVCFSEINGTNPHLPSNPTKKRNSPSERQRHALFILHQKQNSKEDFDKVYYPREMEIIRQEILIRANRAEESDGFL